MGLRWRRRFPDTPKEEIRAFLQIFADVFCFTHKEQNFFSPDDRVLDIYRALTPPGMPDDMEIERLLLDLEEHYGVVMEPHWREEITLGELFALATKVRR